jgi:hypothetical protein
LSAAELRILVTLGQNSFNGKVTNGARSNLNGTLDTLLGSIVIGMEALK